MKNVTKIGEKPQLKLKAMMTQLPVVSNRLLKILKQCDNTVNILIYRFLACHKLCHKLCHNYLHSKLVIL